MDPQAAPHLSATLQRLQATAPAGVQPEVTVLATVLEPALADIERGDPDAAYASVTPHTAQVRSASMQVGEWVGRNCLSTIPTTTVANVPTGPGDAATFCASVVPVLRRVGPDLSASTTPRQAGQLDQDQVSVQQLVPTAPPAIRGSVAQLASSLARFAAAVAQQPSGAIASSLLGDGSTLVSSIQATAAWVKSNCSS